GAFAPLPDPASRVDSGFVSWDTSVILKDNDSRRDYEFLELVSLLGGHDVGVIQPPFAFLPRDPQGGAQLGGGVTTRNVVVENIPFAYAIPMLTGWELHSYGTDIHVKDLGVWIEDWSYAYTAGDPGGTMTYTVGSVLGDNDYLPSHDFSHRVTILGI